MFLLSHSDLQGAGRSGLGRGRRHGYRGNSSGARPRMAGRGFGAFAASSALRSRLARAAARRAIGTR